MFVTKRFTFHAAHHLTGERMKEPVHGHGYDLEVTVEGDVDEEGVVQDFRELKGIVERTVISAVDHTDLNLLLDQPTAENMAAWIWARLEHEINLYELKLWETATSYVTLRRSK